MSLRRLPRPAALAFAAIAAAIVVPVAVARQARPASRPATRPPTADVVIDGPAMDATMTDAEADAGPRRISLLREGSHLVAVVGRILDDPRRGTWRFVIDPGDPQSPSHTLTVLPSSLLDELERIMDAAGGDPMKFELTGRVYVHRNRNYLLPTHTPILVAPRPEPADPTLDDDEEPAPPRPAPSDIEGDTAEDIIRSLRAETGPLPSRPAADPDALSALISRSLVREGTILFSRRGRVRRTGHGTNVFVLDADAAGLEDPPMILLPCMLLERLEQYARIAGDGATVLLNGQVFVYRGQNYLLPTLYQIPLDRSRIVP